MFIWTISDILGFGLIAVLAVIFIALVAGIFAQNLWRKLRAFLRRPWA